MGKGLASSILLLLCGVLVAPCAPAAADDVSGSATRYVGPGNSYEYLVWNATTRRERMVIYFEGNPQLSSTYCLDIKMDVRTGGGHYDARVLRNCNPGYTWATDPGGDGYWEDPEGWQDRSVTAFKKLVAYSIEDNLSSWSNVSWVEDGDNNGIVWAAGAPSQGTRSVRIRTLYDNGDEASEIHELRRCPGSNIPGTWNCI